MPLEKEFSYSEMNFQYIKAKVKALAGIHLSESKHEMVYARISRLLRTHHFNNFDEYCNLLEKNDFEINKEFVNAITTNFTCFMRESHHFEYIRHVALPEIIQSNIDGRKIRIWSAGCSTGEEAYSVAFILKDFFGVEIADWDIKILATDIDSDALNKAKVGSYDQKVIEEIPEKYRELCDRNFEYCPEDDSYHVDEKIKKLISFKIFNLMSKEPWPMKGPFDLILCRNVIIYFEKQSQHQVIYSLSNFLARNGYLILGHSESFPSAMPRFIKTIKGTIFRRSHE